MLDIGNYDEIRSRGELLYGTLNTIYCPYFKDHVGFNSQGYEHLIFKRREEKRDVKDQFMRFKLLHLVPLVLGATSTLQGIWKTKHFEKVRVSSRNDVLLKDIVYYEFISVTEGKRIKIIVKEVERGPKIFWSIIPYWKKGRNNPERKMYDGRPDED